MDLRAKMVQDMRTLVRLDHFGEEVTLTPAGGTAVTVRCVVNRRDLQPLADDVRNVARLVAVVTIPRDATIGVLTIAPGDTVSLALRLGGATVTARVTEVREQDEGAFEVLVAS